MTKRESLIISAYTGYMVCKQFSDLHEFIEQTMERPVFTHELADENLIAELKNKLHPQFIEIIEHIEG